MKFLSMAALFFTTYLAAGPSDTQAVIIKMNSSFIIKIDEDEIIVDVDDDPDPPSDFPVPLTNVVVFLQATASVQIQSPLGYKISTSFIPKMGGSNLTWDENDVLILTSDSFNTALLWDGSQASKNFLLKSNGDPGLDEIDYLYSYARFDRKKPPGKLEGVVVFTVTLDEE
jgi:hypothetical protein